MEEQVACLRRLQVAYEDETQGGGRRVWIVDAEGEEARQVNAQDRTGTVKQAGRQTGRL